ncbi:hypothetical protein DER45DRAFT_213328 [Fusarium avenaceum]|nr:hypothetical protein DER45DRAFT_213328 [Fusarium avenaceum]
MTVSRLSNPYSIPKDCKCSDIRQSLPFATQITRPAATVSQPDDFDNDTSGNAMQKDVFEFGVVPGFLRDPTLHRLCKPTGVTIFYSMICSAKIDENNDDILLATPFSSQCLFVCGFIVIICRDQRGFTSVRPINVITEMSSQCHMHVVLVQSKVHPGLHVACEHTFACPESSLRTPVLNTVQVFTRHTYEQTSLTEMWLTIEAGTVSCYCMEKGSVGRSATRREFIYAL